MGKTINCTICNSKNIEYKNYNIHSNNHLKTLIRRLILQYDFILNYFQKILPLKIKNILTDPFKGKVIFCNNCGYALLKNAPSKESLKSYYSTRYWSQRKMELDKIIKDYQKDFRGKYQVNLLLKNINLSNHLNVLEIGGGPCFFSLQLRDKIKNNNSIILNVCEPGDQWGSHYEFHNINKVADFYPFELKQKYNYIHTSHWLEHVLNLSETIRYLKGHLEKGGFLFIEVPNCDFDYWDLPLVDTPHIHFFTPNSLNKLFVDNGFKLIMTETAGISLKQWANKKKIKKENYGFNEKGFWIRSIFQLS